MSIKKKKIKSKPLTKPVTLPKRKPLAKAKLKSKSRHAKMPVIQPKSKTKPRHKFKKADKMNFVMKGNYISVTIAGKPHSFTAAHPSFSLIQAALEKKDFRKVKSLLANAQKIMKQTAGKITLDRGVISYKGKVIDDGLTQHILKAIHQGESVVHYLKFMDNLFMNPDVETRNEIFGHLQRHNHSITDDGCFIAYKAVRRDYLDCHSGTVSNKVGQVPMFPRSLADSNRNHDCGKGYHWASLDYVRTFSGDIVMGVKINPRDVIAVPESDCGKGRCWRYEVVFELGKKNDQFNAKGSPLIETQAIVHVAKDRKDALAAVLDHPTIKAKLAKRQLTKKSLEKQTLGRLQKLLNTLGTAAEPTLSALFVNPLKPARDAAGLTIQQVAKHLDVTPAALRKQERDTNEPKQSVIDEYLKTIKELTKQRELPISFPIPVTAMEGSKAIQ
jgi:hypothetical protein